LYDVARASQVGLRRVSGTNVKLFVTKGSGAVRGMTEIGYISEPIIITGSEFAKIENQVETPDALGKKIKVEFSINENLPSNESTLLNISYPGIGSIEIVRAELYDRNGGLMQIYSDPLNVKILP